MRRERPRGGNRGMRCRKQTILLAAAVLLFTLVSCAPRQGTGDAPQSAAALEVHFFDAGKADAILLTTPDGAVLIDAGEKGFGKTILAYLEEKGVEKLDYLIVTHFDKDHVGGAAKVIGGVAVETVLQSNCLKDSDEYEKYLAALAEAGLEAITVREAYSFTLGGVRYDVDPPRQERYDEDASNNSSLIVAVQNGENRLLLMGDAMTERLAEYLGGGAAHCDVLKLPHHGKDEPLLSALLKATTPAYAVVTSSDKEPESAAVTAALEAAGVETILTREGARTLLSDGERLTWRAEP